MNALIFSMTSMTMNLRKGTYYKHSTSITLNKCCINKYDFTNNSTRSKSKLLTASQRHRNLTIHKRTPDLIPLNSFHYVTSKYEYTTYIVNYGELPY